MLPQETLFRFDLHLHEHGLALDAVLVGGAALGLLGITHRQTRDVDVLHPELPQEVMDAAVSFAQLERGLGHHLSDNWLNNGPSQLKDILPSEWKARLQPAYVGKSLHLTALGRSDLLKTKLFALCDRGTDLPDCIALNPTQQELVEAEDWVAFQDTNEGWPNHVRATFDELHRRLHHGL